MSSINCLKCQYRIWDKNTGLSKGSISKYQDEYRHITICGKCKDKVIQYYTFFDRRYGLNKRDEEINYKKVKELMDLDLKNNFWNKQGELEKKYPDLKVEFDYLLHIADSYNIDLSRANQIQKDGGKYGAMENDINIDIVGLIDNYNLLDFEAKKAKNLREFVFEGLHNFDYESDEIKLKTKNLRLVPC